ncbi:MAG: ATP-binding protein [Anaerolineales bacterium]
MQLLEQLARIGEPPESLPYYYSLIFVLGMAVAIAFSGWRRERAWASARLWLATLGAFLLVIGSLLPSFVLDILGWGSVLGIESVRITPVVVRAASALTLVLIIWIVAFPQPNRWADVGFFGLSFLILLIGGLSAFSWFSDYASLGYYTNAANVWETVWISSHIGILIVGILLIGIRRRDNWLLGVALLLILLPGYIFHSISIVEGANVPFIVRYLELIALPLFAALVYRRVNVRPTETITAREPVSFPAPVAVPESIPLARLDPKVVAALAGLNTASNADELASRVTQAVAHACSGDLCLLIAPPDELGASTLSSAYHRPREQHLSGTALSVNDLPQLRAALEANGPTRIAPEQHAAELRRITSAINLGQIGPALVMPLRLNDKLVAGLMVMGLPGGARREWVAEDEQVLAALRDPLADLLSGDGKLNRMQRSLDKAQSMAATMEDARRAARLEADQLRIALEDARAEAERLNQDILQLRQDMQAAPTEAESDTREKLETAEFELETQRQDLEALQMQVERLSERLAETERQRNEFHSELGPFRANAAVFSTQSTELERLRGELLAATTRHAELQDELEQLRSLALTDEQQAAEWRTQAEVLTQQVAGLRGELDQAQTQRAQLEAEVAQLRSTWLDTERQAAAEWRERFESTQKELAAAQIEIKEKTKPLADARAALEVELTDLREKLEAQQAHTDTLQLDYDFVVQQEQGLRGDLEQARLEIGQLTEKAGAVTAAEAQLQAAHAELAQTRAQLAAKEGELATTAAAVAQVAQLALVQAQFEAMQTQLSEAQAALARKDQQLAEAQGSQAARGQLAEVQAALRTSQEQLGTKERELADAMAALAELSNQTHALTLVQKELADKEQQLQLVQASLTTPSGSPAELARPFLPEASMEIIISLSQELRQPLAAIVGYSDLLHGESVGILGVLQRKFMERIKAACERMEALLNDLIRVTDIDAGTLQLVPESLDVFDIVEDAILSCGAQFREKSINLRLDVADNLPAVSADRDALRQIFTHLLSNAGNASGVEGEVLLQVRNEADAPAGGQGLFIAVKDTGGGVAPDDQPRVFSRHYRADAPLIAGLGDTGVGLSLAKALVEAHGGRIWLTSELGKGSTFNVLLPVHPQQNGVYAKAAA